MRNANQESLMWVPVLLLAMATLVYANSATALPPEPSGKVSARKVADATLAPRPGPPDGRRLHIHMAFAWLLHQASMGNLEPIVKGILSEAKKQLRAEFPTFFPRTLRVSSTMVPVGQAEATSGRSHRNSPSTVQFII